MERRSISLTAVVIATAFFTYAACRLAGLGLGDIEALAWTVPLLDMAGEALLYVVAVVLFVVTALGLLCLFVAPPWVAFWKLVGFVRDRLVSGH
jgi:hypothetical protein